MSIYPDPERDPEWGDFHNYSSPSNPEARSPTLESNCSRFQQHNNPSLSLSPSNNPLGPPTNNQESAFYHNHALGFHEMDNARNSQNRDNSHISSPPPPLPAHSASTTPDPAYTVNCTAMYCDRMFPDKESMKQHKKEAHDGRQNVQSTTHFICPIDGCPTRGKLVLRSRSDGRFDEFQNHFRLTHGAIYQAMNALDPNLVQSVFEGIKAEPHLQEKEAEITRLESLVGELQQNVDVARRKLREEEELRRQKEQALMQLQVAYHQQQQQRQPDRLQQAQEEMIALRRQELRQHEQLRQQQQQQQQLQGQPRHEEE